jgi:GNAT superfamily N-acetyltransferase
MAEPTLTMILLPATPTPDLQSAIRAFDCGDDPWSRSLTAFLRDGGAKRDLRALIGATYLALLGGEAGVGQSAELAGYVNLAMMTIEASQPLADLSSRRHLKRVPYDVYSALLIGRLATDRRYQVKGIGAAMLLWVVELAIALPVPCRFLALHVDEHNQRAIRFYEREGFFRAAVQERGERGVLVLMLKDLLTALEEPGH